ncbi:HAMP domain-containing histidine kinase [Candidatus Parcubacteria bacterium]|nr:HAMP domain-containing histidine kinase [Candidatus Parcubacteria bacterium]
MSIRALLATVMLVALAIAMAFVLFFIALLRTEIGSLLPIDIALQIDQSLQMLLTMQAAGLFVMSVVLAIVVFITIGYLLANPLRELARVMDTYATTGELRPVAGITEAPKEVQSLATSFESLISRVEVSHKRDQDVSRMKSDFISTAAHQLRTPLTGIRWALEALEKEQLTENQVALVQSAKSKGKDLVAVVGMLLDISAIESGKYQYKFEPVDIHALLDEVVQNFAPLAASHQISLFYSHEEEKTTLPSVKADYERIKWVLNNLIENGVLYTPPGGTVRISAEGAEKRVFIRVKDTGIGIPPEDKGNIFERFYRGKEAVSKQNAGSGLGLYIARTIATDHGGDLNFAANKEGPGTTFTLSLPVAG